MAIDWDSVLLRPVHRIFGLGTATAAEIWWAGNPPVTVADAIFNRTHVEITFNDSRAPISGYYPTLGVRQAALPEGVTIRQRDRVLVKDEYFQVVDVQPNGVGELLLILATP